jgi:flagellar hook protein FlgE
MSIGGAFANSVGALIAQSDAMGVISQNIANVNTTGYKSITDNFQTVLSESTGATSATASPGAMTSPTNIFGVQPIRVQNVTQQGPIESTGLWNNLAISGNGFFVVNSAVDGTGQTYFSRDGAFNSEVLNNGTTASTEVAGASTATANATYLTDSNGDFLMGYQAVNGVIPGTVNGVVPATNTTTGLVPVSYQLGATLPGHATTQIDLQAVVPSGGGIPNGVISQETASINGPITVNDTVNITLTDSSLAGSPVVLSYTPTATDTPNTIATALAAQANANATLTSAGIYTVASGTQVQFIPTKPDNTLNFSQSVTRPPTSETVTLAAGPTSNSETASIGGTVSAGDVMNFTVNNAMLPGGTETVSYTVLPTDTQATISGALAAAVNSDANLQAAGITASSSGAAMTVLTPTALPGPTTYGQSVTAAASETVTTAAGTPYTTETGTFTGAATPGDVVSFTVNNPALPSGTVTASYTVQPADTLTSIAAGLASAINATASLSAKGISASSVGGVMTLSTPDSLGATTYGQSVSGAATENLALAAGTDLSPETATIGGTPTPGDVVGLTFANAGLPGSPVSVHYTVGAADTLTNIGAGLAALINSNASLSAAGITASNSGGTITINTPTALGATTYSGTATATGTDTISLAAGATVNTQNATLGGTALGGDVIKLSFGNTNLTGGSESVSYTVTSADTLATISAGLAAAINADPALAAVGITAGSSASGVSITSPTAIGATTYAQSVTGTPTETVGLTTSDTNTVSTGLPVYDNSFNVQTLQMNMTPIGADTWLASFSTPAGSVSTSFPLIVQFDGSGNIVSPLSTSVNIAWNDGSSSTIDLDTSKLTQLASGTFQLDNTTQDGYGNLSLQQVSFDTSGNLYGTYIPSSTAGNAATSQGDQKVLLYQVPVATFVSEDSLTPVSGNLFEQSAAAGPMTIAPVTGGVNPLTTLIPGSIEMSNVDLSGEFTRMITTQQAYSSAAHVFQIADQMTQSVRDLIS